MRVGAIQKGDDKNVWLFGYGVQIEDEIPPSDSMGFGPMLNEAGIKNRCIMLDSGEKVYGCECWWGPEEKIKRMIGDRNIITVNIVIEREGGDGK